MSSALVTGLRRRSAAALASLERRLDFIVISWLLLVGLISAARIAISPGGFGAITGDDLLPYSLLMIAPAAAIVLGHRWLNDYHWQAPTRDVSANGKWRNVSPRQARAHPLYGPGGLMVTLLIGVLFNIPMRGAEYLAVSSPLPENVAPWLSALSLAMTLDVVLLTSLYGFAFIAGLRRAWFFPQLLMAVWAIDAAMQLLIAEMVTVHPMPADVAQALQALLVGNLRKVLISATLWLPYLLISARVNVTYRHRVRA